MVRRLHEASCGAVRAIFRRLLACTTSVDVADGGSAGPGDGDDALQMVEAEDGVDC